MVQYASGSIRVPGLSGQGTDFDAMITKLLKIESRQVNQLMQWQTDWKTRLDAFKQLRGELMNLQTTLTSLNSLDKFLVKSTSSSDEKVATAVADADAMNTSYEVEVNRLATYSTWTRDTGLSKKTDVICENGGSFTYSYKGKYRTVDVPKGTTLEGLIKQINNDSKNPGVKAQLIQSADGVAFQLRGNDTGQSNTLVIRDVQGMPGLGVTLTEETWGEAESTATLLDPVTGTDVLNTGPDTKTFIYTLDGTRYTIDVDPGDDVDTLISKINAKTPGVASLQPPVGSPQQLVLKREDTGYELDFATGLATGLETILGIGGTPQSFASPTTKILGSGQTAQWTFELDSTDGSPPNDKSITIDVNDESTLTTLANSLRLQLGNQMDVKIVSDGGSGYILKVESKDVVHRLTVENGTLDDLAYTPPTAAGWDTKYAENAQVRINGYPQPDQWMEVASNTLKSSEVIPGITFTLLKGGGATTNISVNNNTEAMMENIQAFVDSVNSFRMVLASLTAYDEEKEVVDLDYAESQFEMQKGGVLMGNYGVQMVSSRLKNCIAATSIGFMPLMKDSDGAVIGGDYFSSLSQIGITTNANQGEATYGLLEINFMPGQYGSKSLQQALDENPEAVAALFATKSEGKSNSDYFHYDSHLSAITKAGTYNVTYDIDGGGNIVNAKINGQTANVNQQDFTITSMDGPSKGLTIKVANDTIGQSYSGTVSIRDGKINELLGLLEGTEGILGANGTMRNLEKNYQGIIDGIESKIKREDERLTKFERTMTLKFARLEEVLQKYSGIQSTLETQLAQLGTNKK